MEALEVRKVLQEIDPKLHLQVEEVAKKLGITRKGVFYLIKNREITPYTYKQGKKDKFYFDKDEIDKVRKSRKEKQKYKEVNKIKSIVEKEAYSLQDNSEILDTDNNRKLNSKKVDDITNKIIKDKEITKSENKTLNDLIITFSKALDNNTKALDNQEKIINELLIENRILKQKVDALSIQLPAPKQNQLPAKNKLSIFLDKILN
jgi:DNA-binding transcriptional regulator GbsR (MarR family)